MSGGSRVFRHALSLPNIITYLRIAAIPAVLVMLQADSRRNAFIAAMIFALASLTDFFDGYLARKLNLISFIGKFLDPLADKLLVTGVLIILVDLGRVSPWVVFVILAREIIITTLRSLAMGEGTVIAARDLGKQKTAFQMVGSWALMVHYEYPLLDFWWPEPVSFHRLGTVLLYISVFFSILSAGDYFVGFVKGLDRKSESPAPAEEGEGTASSGPHADPSAASS